jgi:hypothetical protein
MKTKIIKELCQIAEIMHGKQKTYYEQMIADATPVRIAPLSEVFDEETIRMIKEAINPQPKECYRNATMLCEMFKGIVNYVEGRYTVCGLFSTEHAWNKIEDKYIDITAELALGRANPNEEEYVALGEYDDNEVLSYCIQNKVYGGIYEQKFLENYGKDLSNKR